ncbi:putative HTH-type transcriptional regulator ywnA [Bacillus atrophaeus]|nr:putative HTH-type transcriptional regulator ywnA [Bacillus atrophaeus]
MINSRLAVAIHILSIISVDEKASSEIIADSVNTNPVVVRRMISLLKKS